MHFWGQSDERIHEFEDKTLENVPSFLWKGVFVNYVHAPNTGLFKNRDEAYLKIILMKAGIASSVCGGVYNEPGEKSPETFIFC